MIVGIFNRRGGPDRTGPMSRMEVDWRNHLGTQPDRRTRMEGNGSDPTAQPLPRDALGPQRGWISPRAVVASLHAIDSPNLGHPRHDC